MSETKVLTQVTDNFFEGFIDLFQNKHFWMIIFIVASVATSYYYFNNYMNNTDNTTKTNNILENTQSNQPTQLTNEEIQNLIRNGLIVPSNQYNQNKHSLHSQHNQPIHSNIYNQSNQPNQHNQTISQYNTEMVPEHVNESKQVQEQNLSQEELNLIKQGLDQQ